MAECCLVGHDQRQLQTPTFAETPLTPLYQPPHLLTTSQTHTSPHLSLSTVIISTTTAPATIGVCSGTCPDLQPPVLPNSTHSAEQLPLDPAVAVAVMGGREAVNQINWGRERSRNQTLRGRAGKDRLACLTCLATKILWPCRTHLRIPSRLQTRW